MKSETVPGGTITKEEIPGYKNRNLSVEERVTDLLDRMTLEEKVAQMLCIWGQKKTMICDENEKIDLSRLPENLPYGIGQIGRLSDTAGGQGPKEMVELANALQKYFVEETRLGIPVIFHEECLHGLAGGEATSYPQPIGLAATFNPELIEKVYTAIAQDARARGAHHALTPVLDVSRDPRWGRVEETFGEDPYLISRMAIAAINGFQGDRTFKDKKHVLATLKHFAAHGQPESGSNCGPANFSERILRDVYLYPFREAVMKAKPASVMASYNEIDGVPSHINKWLLKDVLRDEWGFEGFVVSDYYAITELNAKEDSVSQGVAKDKKEAALLSALAGVNIEFPEIDCYPNLIELVNEGALDAAVIDELVASMLKYKFMLGLFDEPYVDPEAIQNEIKLEQDRKLALQAAHETITLLQNEGKLLPLNVKKNKTIAVIGPNANYRLLGGYSGRPVYYTTVLEGIKEKAGAKTEVLYSEGCKLTVGGTWNDDEVVFADAEENRKLIKKAVAVAKKADTVILVIGENEQTSREAWSKTHLGDRSSLDLFGQQNELVEAIVKTGKPVVAVVFNGRPNSITYVKENIPAVLECWYLGQETGKAVADVLFGDFNPCGKLPVSIPRSVGHIPCHYNHKPSARRGYLDDDINPLFPFGYGLSYTKFSYENIRLKKSKIGVNESTSVLVDLKNTGRRAGTEVVQMYIHDVISSVTRPVKELRGIKKIMLKAGETVTVEIPVLPEHLAFTNIEKQHVVEPGEFEIMVGGSSRDKDLEKVILTVK